MEICKYCGKEFEKKLSLAAHIGHCKSKPNFINRDYHLSSKKAALKRKLIIENKIAEGDPDYTYKYLKKDIKCSCKKCNKEYIIHITQRDFDRDNYSHYCCNSCRNSHILSDEIKLNISGIMIKVNEETLYTINEELFNDFQSIVRTVSGLQLLRGDEDIEYNAESEAAKKIKEKLVAGRRKAAQLKAEEAEKSGSSLLGNYLDILVVGCGYSYEQLNHYTIPQIFLAVEKYQAYYSYELDFRCRMVGGGDKNSTPDNWMLEQKKNNS